MRQARQGTARQILHHAEMRHHAHLLARLQRFLIPPINFFPPTTTTTASGDDERFPDRSKLTATAMRS
ncbi:hypothetical protein LINGRAHAP2_LOCUS25833 [Linum grandiflorum]